MPLVSLDHVSLAFGHLPLLDDVSLQIEPRERVSIIGRNGSGKSTLLQVISGEATPDGGTVWHQPAVRIARLVQDIPLNAARSVADVVADGLAGGSEHDEDWQREYKVDLILTRLDLPRDTIVDTLSGGWRRRVLLARALVAEPDVLLLDEPTNHLDIEAISWLESFLAEYRGSVVFVTHDRAFLQRLATRVVELDRGILTSWAGDYATFLRKKEEFLANETIQRGKFDKRLAEEEVWLRQGIKARRTRDEGRVRALLAMRVERAQRREVMGTVNLKAERADASGKLVFEADEVSKTYGERAVVRDFSTRVMRGDRIGLIGPNGAGKTTLLRMLLGQLEPDSGNVRLGANVQIAYYDQQREQLDPERTVFDTVGEGSDTVTVNGESRHVHSYLKDFLFPPERARSPVKALSGGERNRLLLARLFTRPANVLVLDEPTNDLDIETLELLEAVLVEWPGTLLLVTHDRVFLDNVVSSTLVFEGEGRVAEYVGGYVDWQRQRHAGRRSEAGRTVVAESPAAVAKVAGRGRPGAPPSTPAKSAATPASRTAVAARKLSSKERRELETVPKRIETLEAEQTRLQAAAGASGFYKEPADQIARTLDRIAEIERELLDAYARWDELDSKEK